MQRIVIVLLMIGAALTTSCKKIAEERAAANNPFPESSPLHTPFDHFLRRMATDPRFDEFRKQIGTDGEATAAGIQLTGYGYRRLDPARLETRAVLMNAMLTNMDEASCAHVTRATPNDHQNNSRIVFQALEKLPPEQIDEWFNLSFEAAIAQLTQQPEINLSQEQIDDTIAVWLQSLPEDQINRVQTILNDLASADDADICWVARTMYASTLKLDEPQRRTMSQILVLE
ncbi:MAG: hypothetical protein LBV45_08825 [Xanthomonadaceae bacterium]|nr:hypothetical protein [Xanthomonadaceae bacterium]